jgi:ribonuclease J
MDSFFDNDSTIFIPLGGSGEIGSNLNLYGYRGKWLMLDCGVSFGDGVPGIDTTMPDPGFIAQRRDDLAGLVLTHGHEDHLGAVEYIWDQFQGPVFATPFTAALLRLKLGDSHKRVRIIEMQPGDKRTLGSFTFEFIAVTHSIPDAVMVLIETPTGRFLHTGDWKFDPQPLLGPVSDLDRLKEIGAAGVLAVIGDSTNAPVAGRSGSEAEARQSLTQLVKDQPHRVIITCFASNVARLRTIADVAQQNGRTLAFIGRSLWRMLEAAKACGYWDYPDPIDPEDAGFTPRPRALYVTTGCQGEKRAALSRMADDSHPDVMVEEGDTVIFSSRDIPGNEETIEQVQRKLVDLGARVITLHDAPVDGLIHVSGHPAQDELKELYSMVRPHALVPVHGEPMHQQAHADVGRACGIKHITVPANGDVLRLTADGVDKIGTVKAGKLGVMGKKLVTVTVDPDRHRTQHVGGGS